MKLNDIIIDNVKEISFYDMSLNKKLLTLEGLNNCCDKLKECIDYINKKHDEQIKNKLINCPNCGAPITDYMCEYCGTVF